jgi:hypothetical protein
MEPIPVAVLLTSRRSNGQTGTGTSRQKSRPVPSLYQVMHFSTFIYCRTTYLFSLCPFTCQNENDTTRNRKHTAKRTFEMIKSETIHDAQTQMQ